MIPLSLVSIFIGLIYNIYSTFPFVRNDPFILSGGDDGMLKVWDLRQFQKGVPVAAFKHHGAPITSVEWHPTDSTVFAASGDDKQITIWDLAVEKDDEHEDVNSNTSIPPQLLFIHMVSEEFFLLSLYAAH